MQKRFTGALVTMLLLAVPIAGLWQRQVIYDQIRLYNYVAPSDIAQLATDTSMLDSTRRLFYVYHPGIKEKVEFNAACRENERTIVLGCYVEGRGIYLLKVTDTRLVGIEQVTAAHETLHAAYARLNSAERKKIDAMTAAYFTSATDQRLKETIGLYKKQDTRVVPNELHSILGTEVRTLPSELEDYYKRYFADRSKVVSYSEQYEQAFTERKNQIVAYEAQLSDLKEQITTQQNTITAEASQLGLERERLNSLRSSGQTSGYNQAVPGYNTQINKYNSNLDVLSNIIIKYNDIVPKLNAIASEESDLVKAIDSRSSVPARQ